MILKSEAIAHNIELMSRFSAEAGVQIAPHAKTHLSKDLCERQLAAGAWGFTAATTAQVRTLIDFGVRRILQANLLVDRDAIAWVARTFLGAPGTTPWGGRADGPAGEQPEVSADAPTEHPEFFCYVDSLDAVALLQAELGRLEPLRPLRVLVERGFPGGRTGARSDDHAIDVGRAVAAATHLELAGVAGFEGLMPVDASSVTDPRVTPRGTREFLAGIRSIAKQLHEEGLFPGVPIVSAGGSSYFDLVVEELAPDRFAFETVCVLRSGCYITHDHGVYERTSPFGDRAARGEAFEPALELHASVLSQPEPGLVIVGFGRREVPTDDRLPVVLGMLDTALAGHSAVATATDAVDTTGWTVFAVNDHHAFVRVPENARAPIGTVLRFGISHPCGAFDRWRSIDLVDARGSVVGAIRPAL